jgi:hypothetical protein
MMNLKQRVERTEQVLARFRDKPFAWNSRGNCIHLAKAQARALGVRTPSVPRFSSYSGAVKALKGTGHDTLEALLDTMFRRIPPAKLLVGDLAMVAGVAPFGSLTIACGGAYVLGWHEQDLTRMVPIEIARSEFIAAWAVGR